MGGGGRAKDFGCEPLTRLCNIPTSSLHWKCISGKFPIALSFYSVGDD